jgi:hypothetical protein
MPAADTFQTRIPTLTDTELREYLNHFADYRFEAVEAAQAELVRRGHLLPEEQSGRLAAYIATHREPPPGFHASNARRFRFLATGILTAGLCGALLVYLMDRPELPSLIPEPMDSKKFLRQLEMIGGKWNVHVTEFLDWLARHAHGRPLALFIAVISILVALYFWRLSLRQELEAAR